MATVTAMPKKVIRVRNLAESLAFYVDTLGRPHRADLRDPESTRAVTSADPGVPQGHAL